MPWYFSCKSHWFCGLVQIHPQDVVVFILNTATESGWLSPWDPPLPWGKVHEEFTAPQHTRFILPPIHPTKSSLRCVGGIFLLRELHIENFMSRPDVIPTFCQRRCKTGVGTSFGANGDQHTRAAEPSTYFCVLTIRKQLPRNGFERSGRGQEPSRGHKFSILENSVFLRDYTSATLVRFRSASCWGVPAPNPAE